MKIKSLELTDFRNYHKRSFDLSNRVTVLVGVNATGKTNILEAIHLLATGDSFQAQKIEEMVGWEEETAHVVGAISNEQFPMIKQISNDNTKMSKDKGDLKGRELEITGLHVVLTRGIVQGRRVQKRRYLVNGVARRKQDFVGNFFATAFRPQDLRLMEGSPARRREYFDTVLTQVDADYRRSLGNYEKGLRRRNKVLTAVREGETRETALAFWNQLLLREGEVLFEKRQSLAEHINEAVVLPGERRFVYKKSLITAKRMDDYRSREIAAGHTLIGPHKDDFAVFDRENWSAGEEGRDLHVYGSRGEQRMAVLWLKLVELDYIASRTEKWPVLLLDDIFSELDDEHDEMVMDMMRDKQTIVTTTDERKEFDSRGWRMIKLDRK